MTTIVLHIETPTKSPETVEDQVEAIRAELAAHPAVEAVEAEAQGPTRSLDAAAAVQLVLAAVTTAKTLVETVKVLRDIFAAKKADDDKVSVDQSRVFLEIGGRLVRLKDLTEDDLKAVAGTG
jgi:hypothetical protein